MKDMQAAAAADPITICTMKETATDNHEIFQDITQHVLQQRSNRESQTVSEVVTGDNGTPTLFQVSPDKT